MDSQGILNEKVCIRSDLYTILNGLLFAEDVRYIVDPQIKSRYIAMNVPLKDRLYGVLLLG